MVKIIDVDKVLGDKHFYPEPKKLEENESPFPLPGRLLKNIEQARFESLEAAVR